MEQLKVNFELIDTRNSNNIKSFGYLYFNTKKELVNYMFGYLTAYKELRKCVQLYAFNAETHELIHSVI